MSQKELKVTFQPSGKSVYVLPGTIILEAAARAGIILQAPCGGRGTCGKCRVRVVSGDCVSDSDDPAPLTEEQFSQGYRLACRSRVHGTLVVEVPGESLFENQHQVLVKDSGEKADVAPAVIKKHFKLPEPSQENPVSDVSRLKESIGNVFVPLDLLTGLPRFLRRNDWFGTAVIAQERLLALEKGDTTAVARGVAFDMGTTTIVGTLFDLVSGKELAVASELNPQIAYGDDVISRIQRVREVNGGLSELRAASIKAVNGVLTALCREAGASPDSIYEVTLAGNATMQQIFCGIDPSALGEIPFVQAFEEGLRFSASWCSLQTNPSAEIYVFPQIGGFVGGDTVAGMVAARIDRWDKPVLLVDIGTNGEMVLAHDGKLLATSTAAGPAFEGARIVQGMRAATGAVEKVLITDDVYVNVIGNTRATGLCGTALIDAAAGMLRAGVLDSTGRILSPDELSDGVPDSLRKRLVEKDGETNFMLVGASETASRDPLYVWQKDIRELQLATGAIRAGVNILLQRAGLKPEDLGAVLLAGAFGNFIRRNNARRIGLLPQISCSGIRFIGNAASMGAKLALLSLAERRYAETLCAKAEHIDLSLDPEFQMEFSMGMMFPEGDVDHCD